MGELSAFCLDEIIENYKATIYVETGTGLGVSLAYAKQYPFKKFYSVDIDCDRVVIQRRKYVDEIADANMEILCMISTDFLERIMVELPQDCSILWFLDAHFPKADFDGMSYEDSMRTYMEQAIPLKDELYIIKKNRHDHDVIIIDDLILLEDGPFEHNTKGGWKFGHIQAELGLTKSTDFIEEWFGDTHNIQRDYRHQGYLILTPKKVGE